MQQTQATVSASVLIIGGLFSLALGALVIVLARRSTGRGRVATFLIAAGLVAVLPTAALVLAAPVEIDEGAGVVACGSPLEAVTLDQGDAPGTDPVGTACADAGRRRVAVAAGLAVIAGAVVATGAALAGFAVLVADADEDEGPADDSGADSAEREPAPLAEGAAGATGDGVSRGRTPRRG